MWPPKARTVAANQIDAVVVKPVKDRLRALNTARTVEACARMRPDTHGDLVRAAAKRALAGPPPPGSHCTSTPSCAACASQPGAAGRSASACCCAARRPSSAPAPSMTATGSTAAATARPTTHCGASGPPARRRASIAYAEGKTRREILRCLKRHIAREVYKLIIDPPDVAHGADLRRHRTQRGLTIHQTARALGAAPNRISELERGIIHNRDLAERYQRHLAQTGS